MSTTHSMPAMNRRTFIGGALATGAMLAMAGRGATAALADEATANAVQGGDLKYYLTNPVGIEPFSAEENQGVSVIYNTFDPLCT